LTAFILCHVVSVGEDVPRTSDRVLSTISDVLKDWKHQGLKVRDWQVCFLFIFSRNSSSSCRLFGVQNCRHDRWLGGVVVR
jgi:hypothetical protein